MLKTKIWDRKEPINGLTAEEFLNASPWIRESTQVVLGYTDEFVSTTDDMLVVKNILKLEGAPTDEEVVAAWKEYLNNPPPPPVDEATARIVGLENAVAQLAFGKGGVI